MASTQISNIRGSTPSRRLKPSKKRFKTKRRSREDVQIKFVNPDGKVVTETNMRDFLRSMMREETRTFAELARETSEAGGVKSGQTLSRLFYGESQQPKLATQVSVMGLYGYEMKIVRRRH